ncbi:TonB-dependent receptor [Pedobacter alluvionis]|uniref:Outer membrane receptor protein involved in Fe transport n=1 Tax=Pedobacter alluvionis TaxID=475253 RepID=A0A497Y8P5_9SPHI|nr:TonB-dependent receptor [Pedobacter alluvionis]RLJ79873.1 outer membrane receptor protein involved in Fe transport [Pedobacter alluvionis]TFB31184.1 TonB-dependent receptor [Pedobacter alluvionis]
MELLNSFKRAALTVLALTISILSYAQTGKISGTVTDKKTGETLIGVTVKIKGTTKGMATDVDGKYLIGGLATGKYILTFQYVGYSGKEIADIEVLDSKITSFNVILEESNSQTLSDVVIQGSFKKESINALYAQQKNSISISSGISAEIIQKSPDRNTSEVLKRVSGASIQNNKFVVIRGLADRYNTSMLNNSILPSTEPDKKAFSFDIIPANLIDNIIVYKTASPDLPGDFAGGIIQVVTKDVPDQSYLSFSTSWGYNTQSTFNDFTSNKRGSLDYLGLVESGRKLPSSFPKSFQTYNPLTGQEKVNFSKLLPNAYGEQTYTALPSQNHQITWGNRKDFQNGGSLGSVISLSYRNSQNINPIQRNDYQNDFSDIYYNYNDTQNIFNTSVGILANITYKKGKNKFGFKNLLNNVLEDTYTDRNGFNTNVDANLRFNNSDQTRKTIYNTQLDGEHQFGKADQKINWNLSYSNITRDQPDLRSIYYRQVGGATSNVYSLVDRNSRRFFADLKEDNYSALANYTLPFILFEKKSTFKAGYLGMYKTRDFNARIFNYLYNSSGSAAFDDSILTLPKGSIFSEANMATTGGFYLNDFTGNTDSYKAQTMLNAGYFMLDNHLGEKSRLSWGARVEQYSQNIDYTDLSGVSRSFEQTFIDVLPSANYTYSINDKSNFRVSASRTVSRPELRELSPFTFYDFVSQTSTLGNPNLKRGTINNADLRYEIYPAAGEAVTFSVFYKDFNNAIEQTLDEGGTPERRQINYTNVSKAYSFGAEIDVRKRFDFIKDSGFFNDLTFFANLSYIKSEVKLNTIGLAARPLQGQSPYLINAGLQYSNTPSGVSLTALYNRIGQRISFVGNTLFPSIWENSRDVVDLQISKKLLKNRAELKLNAGDIFNQKSIFYLNMDDKTNFDKNIDKEYVSTRFGSNITLSFSYNLSFTK